MTKPAIEVKKLSKSYVINHQKESSKKSAIKLALDTIQKPLGGGGPGYTHETFWALKDVSFEIQQGEVFGVLGKNGSGKSTLLKILSRIVDPTEGEIKIRGRIASLLEVGTGFHPELTGRENVFLNGSMLGLSRREIIKRFSEIVEFSEIEKFIDTPVKYYSSGMYVRLAFSVAAHLEPDVLILDEVLSVGDANFQKKSQNRILETMRSGCTVLMVSHSAENIRSLCKNGLLLDSGDVKSIGKIDKVLMDYKKTQIAQIDSAPNNNDNILILQNKVLNANNLTTDSPFEATVEFNALEELDDTNVILFIEDSAGRVAIHNGTRLHNTKLIFSRGINKYKVMIPRLSLNNGTYSSWFRISYNKNGQNYSVDSERKVIEVEGRKAMLLSLVDVPTIWEKKK